jgi:hypothetical protein|tara:strand:+ start:360 stop:596 length:237 start_codon:yes stop_codon:yes gene_type:complete
MAISRANIGKEIKMAGKKKKLDIKKVIKKPGALRATLKIKKGKKIPASKLNAAAKKKGVTGDRARFAKLLKKLNQRRA